MVRQYWIDEHKIMGSGNPATEVLRTLYQDGFRTIISLIPNREIKLNYDVQKATEMGYIWRSIPIPGGAGPSHNKIRQFLEILNEALHRGKIVIHCQGGHGRTGTMGAAYWISKGLTAENAIGLVRQANPLAVESPEQKDCLCEFERSFRRAL